MILTNMAPDTAQMAHEDIGAAPLSVRTKRLSDYPACRTISHWHDGVEMIRVLEGRMAFRINEREISLGEDDCIIVSSRQMHYNYPCGGGECRYVCVLASPELFSEDRAVREELFNPLIRDSQAGYFRLRAEEGREVAGMIDRLASLGAEWGPSGSVSRRLEMIGVLHLILARVSALSHAEPQALPNDPMVAAQRDMISYICGNYAGRVTLAEIAAAGRVCRSRCCSLFRKYLGQSPIDFLNSYRLEVSRNLLKDTALRIAEISASCGFVHQSYYSKLFVRKYGRTPNEYRASVRAGAV